MSTPDADRQKAAKLADLAVFREFRRLRAENPFHAAELLQLAGASAIERGRAIEEDQEPPPAAA